MMPAADRADTRKTSRSGLNREQKVVLEDAYCRTVFDMVSRRPGLLLTAIRKGSGMGWSTLYRSVDKLRRVDLIQVRKTKREKLLFPAGIVLPAALTRKRVMLRTTSRRLAEHILANPGKDAFALAHELELTMRVTYHHLRRLLDARLIKRNSKTRFKGITPTRDLFVLLHPGEGPAGGTCP